MLTVRLCRIVVPSGVSVYRPFFVEVGIRDGFLPFVWPCVVRGLAMWHSGRCRCLVFGLRPGVPGGTCPLLVLSARS